MKKYKKTNAQVIMKWILLNKAQLTAIITLLIAILTAILHFIGQ